MLTGAHLFAYDDRTGVGKAAKEEEAAPAAAKAAAKPAAKKK